LGRYSLWIYVIHQPVILLLLTVIMGQTPWIHLYSFDKNK
jgi:uncharacterized membrane protein